jgi:hypothetical protein
MEVLGSSETLVSQGTLKMKIVGSFKTLVNISGYPEDEVSRFLQNDG